MNYVKKYLHNPTNRVARNFCGSLFLRIGDILCFAGTKFLRFGQSGFPCWDLILTIFRKYLVPSIEKFSAFSFLVRTCNRNTYFQTNKPVFHCIPFCF